ncbi:C6 zinc finger domain protein [Apiospora saccharicola]
MLKFMTIPMVACVAVINELLERFFMHVHSKNPILDETEKRRVVRAAFMEGLDWSSASFLALLICALGSISISLGPSHDVSPRTRSYQDAEAFFSAAQKRMGPLFLHPSIIVIQCLFLSGVYLMCVFRPTYTWRCFSQALAACQGFHFLNKDAQVQDRTSPSSDISSEDVLEQAVGTPDGHTDPVNLRARGSWLFYLAEISLQRLNSRLSSEIKSLHDRYTTPSPAIPSFDATAASTSASPVTGHSLQALAGMIPEYENQAQQWADSLPKELTIS